MIIAGNLASPLCKKDLLSLDSPEVSYQNDSELKPSGFMIFS